MDNGLYRSSTRAGASKIHIPSLSLLYVTKTSAYSGLLGGHVEERITRPGIGQPARDDQAGSKHRALTLWCALAFRIRYRGQQRQFRLA